MRYAHFDHNNDADVAALLHVDPEYQNGLEKTDPVIQRGVQLRWLLYTEEIAGCDCGISLFKFNRAQRRKMETPLDGGFFHNRGCAAVDPRTSLWLYRRRKHAQK